MMYQTKVRAAARKRSLRSVITSDKFFVAASLFAAGLVYGFVLMQHMDRF
jgi:hypothetical protein